MVLASLSAVKFGGHQRPVLAFTAIAILAFLAYARFRAHLISGAKPKPTFDAYERALRIQEEREAKYRR